MVRYGLPPLKPSVGTMLTSPRLPPAMEFALPGSGSNQIIPLLSRMPVPFTTTRDPQSETAVLVSETMLRCRSMAPTWVVQSSVRPAGAAAPGADLVRGRARVLARDEPFPGRLHDGGVSKVLEAVAECALDGAGAQVQTLHARPANLRRGELGEDVQRLERGHTARCSR